MGRAERESGAICCPVELSSLLTNSFKETDQKLLSWLQSEHLCLETMQASPSHLPHKSRSRLKASCRQQQPSAERDKSRLHSQALLLDLRTIA